MPLPIHKIDDMPALAFPDVRKHPERDLHGRLFPGSCGGASATKRYPRRAELRKALYSPNTPKMVRELGERIYGLAMLGDMHAAKLWLDHIIGRPVSAVEISGNEGEPLSVIKVVQSIMVALGDDPAMQAKVGDVLEKLEVSRPDIETEMVETPTNVVPVSRGPHEPDFATDFLLPIYSPDSA